LRLRVGAEWDLKLALTRVDESSGPHHLARNEVSAVKLYFSHNRLFARLEDREDHAILEANPVRGRR
jgi:hypothetical protein